MSDNSIFEGLVWVPDEQEIFKKARIIKSVDDGAKYKVQVQGSKKTHTFKKEDVQRCNPASFEKCDDMASLTFLNEPSVVNTLKLRYAEDKIYTFSGLFLVAVNPYKPLNIYNSDFVQVYKKSRDQLTKSVTGDVNSTSTSANIRSAVKPHIFAIAEEAYQYLLNDKQDQSILVTGESGAGKTENTKKVIQYILSVSSSTDKTKHTAALLEDKIMQANPILESFGNATTVRNLNSSRFGKFVKIKVVPSSKEVTGAHIDWYLLEKSRVVLHEPKERNYHVFYQLLRGASQETLQKLKLTRTVSKYSYLAGSELIHSINDEKEFQTLEKAFDIVGFEEKDKLNVYKVLSVILHLGQIEFRNGDDDARQAILTEQSEHVINDIAELLHVPVAPLQSVLLKSKVKAGREVVTQQRTASQAKFAIDALSKSLYERLFQYLVDKINSNFDTNQVFTMDKSNYIGILDIAGFEIFHKNSFEQLCINYTNEKLQQFFNHHMFVLEQSEYLKEGISWQYIDFGHELKPTIELIEGPKGSNNCNVFSILDEECVVPKGSDNSFLDKLFDELETKDKSVDKSTLSFKPNKVHDGFIIKHYAGEVEYSVDGWLDKNKDPLSSSMVEMLTQSKNVFINELFDSADGHITSNLSDSPVKGKKAKTGMFRTVAQRHREQLTHLMDQLSETHPHFVRCILPNNDKLPGKFDNKLVIDQLRCNGVLEGIRISRSGYPNRITFEKFANLYSLLVKGSVAEGHDYKRICEHILKDMSLDDEVYKIGLTKLFFRNGVLASLEKVKEEKLTEVATNLQAHIRGALTRKRIQKQIVRMRAAKTLAQNFRRYSKLSKDPWHKLVTQLKPTILDTNAVESHYLTKIQQLESEISSLTKSAEADVTANKELERKYTSLEQSVGSDRDLLAKKDKSLDESKKQIVTLEKQLQEKSEELTESKRSLESTKKLERSQAKLTAEIEKIKAASAKQTTTIEQLKKEIEQLESDVAEKQKKIDSMKKEINSNNTDLDKSVKKMKLEVEKLQDENTKLETSLKYKDDMVRTKDSQIQTESQKEKNSALKIEQLNAEIKRLESVVAAQKAEISKATMSSKPEDNDKLRTKFKQLKHNYLETKRLLDAKIQEEIDFDKGKQKYAREIEALRGQVSGLQQELAVEKKTSDELAHDLKDSKIDNEKLAIWKKKGDVQMAQMKMRMSQSPASPAISGDSKQMQEEMEMIQVRLASEAYENRQLRARLSKLTGGSMSDSLGSSSNDKELELARASNKRLEKLNVELQKQLLQQKNNIRELHGLDQLEEDYKTKWQLAEMQLKAMQEHVKLPETPLQDATQSVANLDNRSVGGSMDKESLLMRQENLRLSSKLNETQTRLKRLQTTSDTSFVQQEELAKLQTRVKLVTNKNTSLQESLEFYRARAENYYSKIESAEISVQSAKRARELTLNELTQTKDRLKRAQEEFKISDANVAKLNSSIREIERELSDKVFELRKLKEDQASLQEKYENSEQLRASTSTIQNQSRDKEVKMLNEDLLKYMDRETELSKQIKNLNLQIGVAKREAQSLKFQNIELGKEKQQLTTLLKQTTEAKEKYQTESKEYSMKANNLESQVRALKTTNADLVQERDDLLESKRALEQKVASISAEFEDHLQKVQVDASNAVTVVQLSDQVKQSDKEIKQLQSQLERYEQKVEASDEYSKQMKNEAAMCVEENKALLKYNQGLKAQLKDLQSKFEQEMDAKDSHWAERVQSLEDKLYMENATKRDDEQKVYNLQRSIKDLEQREQMQKSTIDRYSEQVDYLEKTVGRLDKSMTELQRKDAENVLKLKRAQREAQASKERSMSLETELSEWRASGIQT